MAHLAAPVTIKRYSPQRLYASAASRYVTLEEPAGMAGDEDAFVVHDTSGEDTTPSVLKQIIIERARHG